MFRYQISDGSGVRSGTVPRWGLWFGLATAAAFGFVMVAVGIGLALLLAPVAIVGGLIARAKLRRMLREFASRQGGDPFQRRRDDPDVIEGDYRVIDEGRQPPR